MNTEKLCEGCGHVLSADHPIEKDGLFVCQRCSEYDEQESSDAAKKENPLTTRENIRALANALLNDSYGINTKAYHYLTCLLKDQGIDVDSQSTYTSENRVYSFSST